MEIQRLDERHYDELLALMNGVFSRKDNAEKDFARDYPQMRARDNQHMRKYFGAFEDGKLVACIGVYPYETVVNGEKLLFATMGNIATHWEHEGKGYMGKLIDRAVQELDELGIDVARLGGLRSRYNRYGFEACGQKISFMFTPKNRINKLGEIPTDIQFSPIEKEDASALQSTVEFYNRNAIAVTRSVQNAYPYLTTLRNTPYLATKDGRAVGYLCVNESRTVIAELFAESPQLVIEIICAWQEQAGENIHFSFEPHMVEEIRAFSAVCEQMGISSPSHFCIRKWEKACGAFLRLKRSYCELPQGELVIGIEGYGALRFFVDGEKAGCEKTDKEPDVVMDRLSATRYIFGLHPPIYTGKAGVFASVWFPLPLGWNGQDRL